MGEGHRFLFCLGREGHEFNRYKERGGPQNFSEKKKNPPALLPPPN